MSGGNIPFEVQEEIIKRFPIKSLIRFRSVSKRWKSLIESSQFIDHYSVRHTQLHRLLLVRYDYADRRYVSVVDDDTFPEQKVSPPIPPSVIMNEYFTIIGSSHGLLCLCDMIQYTNRPTSAMAAIWNPSIRKAVAVVVPNVLDGGVSLGFGVCRATNDPKLVKIPCMEQRALPWEVEVFTLSTGAWRSSYSNLPRKTIHFSCSQVVLDGFLYWLAVDRITMDGGVPTIKLVISFDLTSEEFGEVNLPESVVAHSDHMGMSKLRESLAVLEPGFENNNLVFHVWMMGNGVSKSFTKLFTLNTPDASIRGFRKSGEPIIEIVKRHGGLRQPSYRSLAVYEPSSKQINNLGIGGSDYLYSYTETLLLLDQPDFVIYEHGKRHILKESELKA